MGCIVTTDFYVLYINTLTYLLTYFYNYDGTICTSNSNAGLVTVSHNND